MFQVTADPDKNRLYVTVGGHLEPPERQELATAFRAALEELRPGFDIINDLSALLPTDEDGLRDLAKMQSAATIKGLRTAVRIVRIPLTRLQFERAARETCWEFETAATLEEAEARLDALGPAHGS